MHKSIQHRFCLAAALLCVPLLVQARPVSYPGGWTLMQHTNAFFTSVHTHYSPNFRYSLGHRYERWHNADFQLNSVQANTLLKRWNRQRMQANLYLKAGLGLSEPDTGRTGRAGFGGIAADWETRRYFAGYELRNYALQHLPDARTQRMRLGISPYIAPYNSVHTWLLLEHAVLDGMGSEDATSLILRLFKGVYLFEFGLSSDEKGVFNFIIRF